MTFINNNLCDGWLDKIQKFREKAQKKKWDVGPLSMAPPIEINNFYELENQHKIQYPDDFKEVLTSFCSELQFIWFKDESSKLPSTLSEIFSGGGDGIPWSFKELPTIIDSYKGWIDTCFPNPDDEYDKVWHNKAPFLGIDNGDIIAFDTPVDGISQVVYLSHDGDEFHGSVLGTSFIDFVSKWIDIGCVGPESWQLEPFYNSKNKELDVNCSNSLEWKKVLSNK